MKNIKAAGFPAALTIVLVCGSPFPAYSGEDPDPTGGIVRLFEHAESFHGRASISIARLRGEEGVVFGHGIFETWEQGEKFRVSYWVDPKVGMVNNFEFGWDGEHFQVHLVDDSRLILKDTTDSIRRGELFAAGLAVPNPFYLALVPLMPSLDDCQLCQPTLQYFRNRSNWSYFLSQAKAFSTKASEAGVVIPGGSEQGRPVEYRARLRRIAGKAGPVEELHTIDKVRPDGKLISTLIFMDFDRVGDSITKGEETRFPRRIDWRVLDPDGIDPDQVLLEVSFQIEVLSFSGELDEEIFTIVPDDTVDVQYQGEVIQARTKPKPIASSPAMIGH